MHSQENKIGYNSWSEFYDEYPNPTVAIDDLYFPALYSVKKGKRVLEIGCGTGRHTRRLIQAENSVTAIDISSGMLKKLRQKLQSEKLILIEGDFMSVEIPNAPFDTIVMSLVLEHIDDLSFFFKKARKSVVANGTFYLSEIHPTRTATGVMAHFKTSEGNEVQLQSSPHSELEIFKAATENGFVVEENKTILGTKDLAQLNEKWEKHLGLPLLQIWVLRAIG